MYYETGDMLEDVIKKKIKKKMGLVEFKGEYKYNF